MIKNNLNEDEQSSEEVSDYFKTKKSVKKGEESKKDTMAGSKEKGSKNKSNKKTKQSK